jgi:hypothetical protein
MPPSQNQSLVFLGTPFCATLAVYISFIRDENIVGDACLCYVFDCVRFSCLTVCLLSLYRARRWWGGQEKKRYSLVTMSNILVFVCVVCILFFLM